MDEKQPFFTKTKIIIMVVTILAILIAIGVSLGVTLSNKDEAYVPRVKSTDQITNIQFRPGYSYNY